MIKGLESGGSGKTGKLKADASWSLLELGNRRDRYANNMMTQSPRELTNQGDVTTSCPVKVGEGACDP